MRRWKEKLLGCLESDLNGLSVFLTSCVPNHSTPFTRKLAFKSYLMTIWINLLGQMEPEVKFHSVGILSSDFEEINTPLPVKEGQSKSVLFTLREGSEYRLKLTFSVLHNIVSGLAYTNTVWKAGLQGLIYSCISYFFCSPLFMNALLDSRAPKGFNTSIFICSFQTNDTFIF